MTKIKQIILKWAVRHILKAVTVDDLLRIENGKVFIGKTELTPHEIGTLKSEAKNFQRSMLWKLMNNNLYWIANFKMMKEADSATEMVNGRMMTLTIDTMESFVDKLLKLR